MGKDLKKHISGQAMRTILEEDYQFIIKQA